MDVTCLGEALIDFVALEPGVGVGEASGFVKAPGGAPANVAVGVARLGGHSAFLGKVGDDPFGRFLRDTLDRNGVDTTGMRLDDRARTGLAFVSLRADGERDFVFFRNPSADMLYAPSDLDTSLICRSRAFHFGSIALIQEPSRTTTLQAAALAREAGRLVSYDPNLRPPLWPDLDTAREAIISALPLADVVKVSEEELEFITGTPDIDRGAADVFSLSPRLLALAITRGASGCLVAREQGCLVPVPAYRVDAVDTTGAGDGFVAGFLMRLLAGLPPAQPAAPRLTEALLVEAAEYGCAVGALTCTAKGAIPALPTAGRVERARARWRAGAEQES